MLLTTLFTSLFLCAAQITAKKQAAPTTTTAPAYGVNAPSGYIGVGVFDRTSLDQYATFSCGEGPFQTSGSLFGCGTEKDAMPTSCGGKGAGTLYYTDGFNRPCWVRIVMLRRNAIPISYIIIRIRRLRLRIMIVRLLPVLLRLRGPSTARIRQNLTGRMGNRVRRAWVLGVVPFLLRLWEGH
ncbi:hypothetical protein EJ08DRAFT_321619 [Tothia fuscella]|uniref:Uncharacterized protein n=1 Tax=Tothia fuscella TaxID=1048955 RepID=A0A9P4NNL9_9PEZI|nr:hypothetical protein EJ08DRAFT_321619 [Tothia fuscella]